MTIYSPLFEPVLWEGKGFKILNENALPEKIEYVVVREVSQAIDAVRSMKTRAFGQVLTFLYSGALVAQGYQGSGAGPLGEQLARLTERFCEARPTFDFRGLGDHFCRWLSEWRNESEIGAWITTRARETAAQIVKAREARASRVAGILPDPARIMTHCNVSGELVAVASHCKANAKELSVIVTETRPYLQGSRLTAWELSRVGVAVNVIPDCAIARVIAAGEIDAVIVGSDRSAQNGDIINKVGTYPLALMAKEYAVPFYVLVQPPGKLTHGCAVQIEERPAAELLNFQDRPLIGAPCKRLTARYPAFDITPASLISSLIGFEDLFTPETFRRKYGGELSAPAGIPQGAKKYLLAYGVPQSTGYTYLGQALKAEAVESILVPEMRPELWGAHVVGQELAKRDIPTTLISDNMMGTLFAHGEVQRLCLFYDRFSSAGPESICGALLAARLAKAHGVPIELFEGQTERPALPDSDVSTFLGLRVLPSGVSLSRFGPECIPWSLFRENSGAQP
jgi:methylthioribose-1-phosphate isomerase